MIFRTRVEVGASRVIAVVTLLASAALLAVGSTTRSALLSASHAWTPDIVVSSTTQVVPASAPLCLADDDKSLHRHAPRGETPMERGHASVPTQARVCDAPASTRVVAAPSSVPARGYDATAPPLRG